MDAPDAKSIACAVAECIELIIPLCESIAGPIAAMFQRATSCASSRA